MSSVYRKILSCLFLCLVTKGAWAIVLPITKFDYVYYNMNTKGTNIYMLDASKKDPSTIEGYISCGALRSYCGTLQFSDVDGSLAEYGLQIDQSCTTPDPTCKNRGSITVDPTKMKKTDFFNKEFSVGVKNEGMKEPLIAKFVLSYAVPARLVTSWDDKFKKSNGTLGLYYPSPTDPDYATLSSTATLTIKNPSTHKIRIEDLEYTAGDSSSYDSFDTDRLRTDIDACRAVFDGGDGSAGGQCQIHFTFINTTNHPSSTPAVHTITLSPFQSTDLAYEETAPVEKYKAMSVLGQDVLSQCPSVNEIKSNWDNLKAHWGIIDPLTNSLTANYDAIRARVEKGEVFFTWYETYRNYSPTQKSTDPRFKDTYKNVFLCRYNQTLLLSLDEDLFRTRPPRSYGALFTTCSSDNHNPEECWFKVGRGLYEWH